MPCHLATHRSPTTSRVSAEKGACFDVTGRETGTRASRLQTRMLRSSLPAVRRSLSTAAAGASSGGGGTGGGGGGFFRRVGAFLSGAGLSLGLSPVTAPSVPLDGCPLPPSALPPTCLPWPLPPATRRGFPTASAAKPAPHSAQRAPCSVSRACCASGGQARLTSSPSPHFRPHTRAATGRPSALAAPPAQPVPRASRAAACTAAAADLVSSRRRLGSLRSVR